MIFCIGYIISLCPQSGFIPNSILHVTAAAPQWDIELYPHPLAPNTKSVIFDRYLYPSGAMQWILVALLCTM